MSVKAVVIEERAPADVFSSSGTNVGERKASRPSAAFWLVATALLVRLVMLVAAHGFAFVDSRGVDDSSFFNETTNIAASIAGGHGFTSPMLAIVDGDAWTGPSSWISPVYPYFTAGVFRLFGTYSRQSFLIIILFQCLFSAFTCIPILRIGELTTGRRAGILASALWAVFPWFGKWAITWIWEISLSTLLATCLVWYALQLERDSKTKMWTGFGALWGFALLVNPALLTLLVASAVWAAWRYTRAHRTWTKKAVLAAATCALVASPWLIRNRVVFGEWAFLRSNFGFEFWLGNFHGASGRGWAGNHPTSSSAEFESYRKMGELPYVRMKFEIAKRFVREYPSEFVLLTAKRVRYFWDGSAMRFSFHVPAMWLPWSFVVLNVLLLPALIVAWRRRVHGFALFMGVILLYPTPYYITYSQVRYRHVLEPLMLLLISYMVVTVVDKFRSPTPANSISQ